MPVTISNVYTGTSGSSSTSIDATGVVVASGERIIVGFSSTGFGADSGIDATSVDWGTDTDVGTLVTGSNISGAAGACEIWEIASPTAATRTLTVNYSAQAAMLVTVWVVAGADAATDVTTLIGSSITAHEVTVPNVTSADFIVGMALYSGSNNGFLGSEGITTDHDNTFADAGSKDGADGTTGRFGGSSNSARNSLVSAVRLPEAGGGGSSVPVFVHHLKQMAGN